MAGNGINNDFVVVPLIWAQQQDGALASDIISMKNYDQADIYLMIGATVGQAGAVTLHQGTSVSSAGTALGFERYYRTGFILKYDGASSETPAAAGETISGAGGGAGTVVQDTGSQLVCYGYNGTTFVDNETVTCSGGKTVVANGIQVDTDRMVPATASSNTFDAAAVGSKMYCIPVHGSMLTDGYDCVELNVADMNTTDVAAWVILSKPRWIGDIPETAIYD